MHLDLCFTSDMEWIECLAPNYLHCNEYWIVKPWNGLDHLLLITYTTTASSADYSKWQVITFRRIITILVTSSTKSVLLISNISPGFSSLHGDEGTMCSWASDHVSPKGFALILLKCTLETLKHVNGLDQKFKTHYKLYADKCTNSRHKHFMTILHYM